MSILGLEIAPNHFPVVPLTDRTQFIASRLDARNCILFVHGFHGSALETWKGFDSIALRNEALKETDLVFFGYDGLRSNALASAAFFYEVLDGLLRGGSIVQKVRRNAPQYERCVLAAHSLGAVISRWALLRAYKEKSPWLEKIRYLLFAPAHSGGIAVETVGELFASNPISKILGEAARAALPLLNELKTGSAILQALETETREAVKAGCTALRARRVVIAEYEMVVSNRPFADDPFPTAIREARHSTVCKPSEFEDVIQYVVELLA